MDYYLELRLQPNPEITTSHLLHAVYGKLHLALVAGNHSDIGISFPRCGDSSPLLGDTLRLHGSQATLIRFVSAPWLSNLTDYIDISSIREIPSGVRYRAVRRIQVKSSPERLRRRYVRRHGVSSDEAVTLIPDTVAKLTDLPFIRVQSRSTRTHFRLFLHHGEILENPVPGQFNAYGIGTGATVPWF